jgi:hypothetical protein
MTLNRLQRELKAAKQTIDSLGELKAGAELRGCLADVRRRLGRALDCVVELRDDVFALQEQNQQLRRDLADKVCPRLCATGRRCAS